MTHARLFTRMMLSSDISVMTRMHDMLEHDGVEDRAAFSDMMAAAIKHGGLDPRALANDLGYSLSSVYRWIDGTSMPHPSGWSKVVDWVVTALATRIEELHDQNEPAKAVA
jgi:hypothetical protein